MLSIIIPTKNEARYLPTLLASIQSQTLQPIEIIVADAHSTDGTDEIARKAGCRVVDGGMPGPGRNRGAAVATGNLLLFLDADVELTDPFFLEKAVQEFEQRNFDFATCDVHPLSDKLIDKVFHGFYNRYVRILAPFHPHAPGFCILARRAKHELIHGFDESITFCEDHDYAVRGSHVGTFGILRSVSVPVSVRRLERDGRFSVAVKYALADAYFMMIGPIRDDRFHYTFGHK